MNQQAYEWIEMGLNDYAVAKHLNETFFPKPLEIICYHCQQAAEKVIKALIVDYGGQGGLPKLHDLSFLLNQLKNVVEIEDKYYDYADELTPYGVAVRYPNELYLEDYHAENALKHSEEIIIWAKSQLK